MPVGVLYKETPTLAISYWTASIKDPAINLHYRLTASPLDFLMSRASLVYLALPSSGSNR